jgi:hypothetical protein
MGGHLLQVTGTITADTDTDQLMTSNLVFFHNGDAGTSLPTQPTVVGAGFVWDASLTELRFERVSATSSFVDWQAGVFDLRTFVLGTGVHSHALGFGDSSHSEVFELLAAGPAQSPGFLVGTAAVPEPSAFLLSFGIFALFLKGRKRLSAG